MIYWQFQYRNWNQSIACKDDLFYDNFSIEVVKQRLTGKDDFMAMSVYKL